MGGVTAQNGVGNEGKNGSTLAVHLVPILFITFIFFLNFTARIIFAPLLPNIENDLGLSHGEAGLFFFVMTGGYFVSLLGSGFVTARVSHRTAIVTSSVLLGLVLLCISCAGTGWQVTLGMFALGLVTGLYLPSGIATVTNLVAPRQWGTALAIHELAPNLGFVMAPLIAEAFLLLFPWRGVLTVIGIAALFFGLAFARFGRGGEFTGEKPNFGSVSSLFRKPSFCVMILLFCLGISSTVGVYSMLPLYLVNDHEIARTHANALVAFSRVATLFIVFLGGWASDRFGPLRTMRVVFLITGILTVSIGIAQSSWIYVVVILQPMMAVCFFPAGFAVLSTIVPPQQRSLVVSLAIPIGFLFGAGMIPTFLGIMGDIDCFKLGFIILGTCILSGSIILSVVKMKDVVIEK